MNSFEKIAAKNKLTKKMLEALLGKKPREVKNVTTALGGAVGGASGAVPMAIRGADKGADKAIETFINDPKRLALTKVLFSPLVGLAGAIEGGVKGGLKGGAVGGLSGAGVGRLLGKKIDKVRLAKYKAKRNKRLAIGGGSAAGITALLGAKKKSSKKGK